MNKYCTHLIIGNTYIEEILGLAQKWNINIEFEPDPSFQYFDGIDRKSDVIIARGKFNYKEKKIPDSTIQKKHLIINADNEYIAQNIASMIICSQYLFSGYATDTHNYIEPTIYDSKYDNDLYTDEFLSKRFLVIDNPLLSFEIAFKCLSDIKIAFALEKMRISYEQMSINIMSIDPLYNSDKLDHTNNNRYYANAAYAINSAFSVIEELQLEVRSSESNKRFNNNDTGEWNPAVLNDIVSRLIDSNIRNTDTIDWCIRGNKNELEECLKPKFETLSEWCKIDNVNDLKLTFPQAIHYASYLRNFHTAHKFKKLESGLGPYFVFNVQNLSRTILLKKLEIWEKII